MNKNLSFIFDKAAKHVSFAARKIWFGDRLGISSVFVMKMEQSMSAPWSLYLIVN
jgi:hypothetical protein